MDEDRHAAFPEAGTKAHAIAFGETEADISKTSVPDGIALAIDEAITLKRGS